MSARGFIAEQDVMVMPVLREVVNYVDGEIVLIEQRAEKDNFAMVVPCARQCRQKVAVTCVQVAVQQPTMIAARHRRSPRAARVTWRTSLALGGAVSSTRCPPTRTCLHDDENCGTSCLFSTRPPVLRGLLARNCVLHHVQISRRMPPGG